MNILFQIIRSLFIKCLKFIITLYNLLRIKGGKKIRIDFPLYIKGSGLMAFGHNCRIGTNSAINCTGKIEIKKKSHIHHNTIIFAGKSSFLKIGENVNIEPFSILKVNQANWEIGDNVSIASNCLIYAREKEHEGKLSIGHNSNVSNNTIIDVCDDIIIENNVAIANNCCIFTHNHAYSNKTMASWQGGIKTSPVIIKEGAWIGAYTTILPGVIIGKRSIIGSGSVVTKSIPDESIFAGTPAKEIKKI
jgi:acetyltransferase-like isoleucine patch superfamily enzyme